MRFKTKQQVDDYLKSGNLIGNVDYLIFEAEMSNDFERMGRVIKKLHVQGIKINALNIHDTHYQHRVGVSNLPLSPQQAPIFAHSFVDALLLLDTVESLDIGGCINMPAEVIDAFITLIHRHKKWSALRFLGVPLTTDSLTRIVSAICSQTDAARPIKVVQMVHCGLNDDHLPIIMPLFDTKRVNIKNGLYLGGNHFSAYSLDKIGQYLSENANSTCCFEFGDGAYKPYRTAAYVDSITQLQRHSTLTHPDRHASFNLTVKEVDAGFKSAPVPISRWFSGITHPLTWFSGSRDYLTLDKKKLPGTEMETDEATPLLSTPQYRYS